jgi:hypothetical protein
VKKSNVYDQKDSGPTVTSGYFWREESRIEEEMWELLSFTSSVFIMFASFMLTLLESLKLKRHPNVHRLMSG